MSTSEAIAVLKFGKLRVSNIAADLEDVAARIDVALRLLQAEVERQRESPAAPSSPYLDKSPSAARTR